MKGGNYRSTRDPTSSGIVINAIWCNGVHVSNCMCCWEKGKLIETDKQRNKLTSEQPSKIEHTNKPQNKQTNKIKEEKNSHTKSLNMIIVMFKGRGRGKTATGLWGRQKSLKIRLGGYPSHVREDTDTGLEQGQEQAYKAFGWYPVFKSNCNQENLYCPLGIHIWTSRLVLSNSTWPTIHSCKIS